MSNADLIPQIAQDAQKIRALHEARVRAELNAADALAPGSDIVAWRGELLAEIALVKGLAGPAEAAGGGAVSGADGEAAVRALERLGHDPGTAFSTLSRPEPGLDPAARAARLRRQLEAVDAWLVVALDAEAAEDLAAAHVISPLSFGTPTRVEGRTFVAVDGLEASLTDQARKQVVWNQLSAAVPRQAVY